jgi:amino acid transporter
LELLLGYRWSILHRLESGRDVIDGTNRGRVSIVLWCVFLLILIAETRQYHWVSEFASRKYQKVLSYTSGWLSSLCWQSFVASDSMFAAQLLMALAQLQNPSFVVQNWYTALLSILIGTIVTAINVWGAKKLALVENVFVALHVATFFVVLITVAVTSPKNDTKEVFLTFTDNGGNYPLSMSCPT